MRDDAEERKGMEGDDRNQNLSRGVWRFVVILFLCWLSASAQHLAASYGHDAVVQFLIDRGADVNPRG